MTIRPLRVVTAEVDSEMGELQDLLGSAEVAGLGQRSLARLLGPHVRVAADAAPHILGYIVAWALLTLAWHVGHHSLGENFGDLGGRTAWTGRKIVEFSGTHL